MDKQIKLVDGIKNKKYVIQGYAQFNDVEKRLAELGFVEGVVIKIVAIALLKKTFLVNLLNYNIGIRKAQAASILVIQAKDND